MNLLKGKDSLKAPWKTSAVVIFIAILGTILRLLFIDKAEGLWNDEYISWQISAIPLGKNFLSAILAQCHMPVYYLYLKFFIHFFGNSDLMLRLTSVLTGVVSIFGMYFVGKEFKDNKFGFLCATFTSISSFLIYFSQEVRFYSLLFLLAACALLYTLKLAKEQNLSNTVFYLVFNILIILTHTIGFVFVLFNLVFISVLISKKSEKFKKNIIIGWSVVLLVALALLPFVYKTFTAQTYSQWWGHFTIAKLGFLMTDYFSPFLINIVSSPDKFFYNFNLYFAVFAMLPALIAFVGIIRALKTKQYNVLGLFFVSLAFVIVLIIMAIPGKLVFLTKYSIEIYPTLILLVCFGWSEFDNKIIGKVLIFLFCFINLFYIISNPDSAPKIRRNEGHKIVAGLIKNARLKQGDYILINYYPKDRFEKYFNFKGYNVTSITKGNFPEYMGNIGVIETLKQGKTLYKPIFANQENVYFDKKVKEDILNNIKPGQKLTVIILNDVAMFSPIQMKTLTEQPREYKNTPFLFMVFSYLKNEEIKVFLAKLRITRLEQKGSWSAITFTKI